MATAVTNVPKKKLNPPPETGPEPQPHFDPDSYRMTIGEHLEELRTRLVLGLLGFALACVVCFIFGEQVVWYFCRPLAYALEANKLPPTVYAVAVGETFMVYVKISMITAAAFASPWMLYQAWLFIAAGLYPKERKYITQYLPLSIGLLIGGMVFLYFIVLPLMLRFFIGFSIGPGFNLVAPGHIDPALVNRTPVVVPMYKGDPPNPIDGEIWMDLVQRRMKVRFDGQVRVLPFGSDQLVTPIITLSEYIDMVVGMLLSFGLAFQMPLVVLAVVRVGVVDVPTLRSWRRYVWFVIAIIAGVIVPDVLGGMVALMIPLILLFELGLWLARAPGTETGFKGRLIGMWNTIRRALRSKGMGGRLFQYGGFLLLMGLIIHVMIRSRHENEPPPLSPPAPAVAPRPGPLPATQPATQPTTVPAT